MELYFSKWTLPRAIQLVVGVVFLVDYYMGDSFFSVVFGGMMFVQAVFNIGCFSSKGCSTSPEKIDITNDNDTLVYDEVEYEFIT